MGAGIFLGKTQAEISDNAVVVGLGNTTNAMLVWSKDTDYHPFGIGLSNAGSAEASGDQATTDLGGMTAGGFSAQTFNSAKNLILGKTRVRTSQHGVALTALSDNMFLTLAPSIAASGNNAGAVELGVSVGVNQVEAKIGTNTHINEFKDASTGNWVTAGKFVAGGSSLTANADQDVIVRAIADTSTIDFAGGVAGGSNAGVGIGADVMVGVKSIQAHIDSGSRVFAKENVEVSASNKDTDISLAMSLGAAGSYGVSGTASVGVHDNTTQAWIGNLSDSTGTGFVTPNTVVTAGNALSVNADNKEFAVQFSGALGAGGTAGIGASFNVGVSLNTTTAAIGENVSAEAGGATNVAAKSNEESYAITLAGGAGGTVGVGGAIAAHVLASTADAHINGQLNQRDTDLNSLYGITPTAQTQTVTVDAENNFREVNAVGALGAAGTVGVGAGVNVTIAKAKAQAYIGTGHSSTLVGAQGDITVNAVADKFTDDYVVALGASGTVGVAGAINIVVVGETMNDDAKKRLSDDSSNGGRSGDQANSWSDIDAKTNSLNLSGTLSAINPGTSNQQDKSGQLSGVVSDSGNAYSSNTGNADVSGHFTGTNPGNYTQAFIGSNATVKSKLGGVKVSALDTTESRTYAAAFGFASTVGVGADIGIEVVNSTAEAFVGAGSRVDSYNTLEVGAATQERLYSGGFSGAGAIVGVNGSITTAVLLSNTLAYIDNDVQVNKDANDINTSTPSNQMVMVHAESDTKMVGTTGGGGGGVVGVGVVGSTLSVEKTTHASIGERVDIDAGGNVSVDAGSKEYLLNVAFSINGGVVGVTGVSANTIFGNTTEAYIANDAHIDTAGSVRVQALDDAQNWGVSVAGAGGAVGVSGDVSTNIMGNTTSAWVGQGAKIIALGNSTVAVADGTFSTTGLSADVYDSYDSSGNKTTGGGSAVQSAVTYNTTALSGVAVNAVSRESVNHVPVGAAVGGVAVAGGIGVTLFDSATSAEIRSSSADQTKINTADLLSDQTFNHLSSSNLNVNQSVRVSASSDSTVNTFTTGIGLGLGGSVGLGIDTLVFDKNVTAEAGGSLVAQNDVSIVAQNKDTIQQKAASLAVDASSATAGTVSVLVVGSQVAAELDDNSIVQAGHNLTVSSSQNTNLTQVSGVISGSGGAGVGGGLSVFTDKTSSIASLGAGVTTDALNDTSVLANTQTVVNQDTVGFAGGTVGASGSIGVGVFLSLTRAEIGALANINQNSAASASDNVTVQANDNIKVQLNTGAGALGALGGVGVGVGVMVSHVTTDAVIGAGSKVNAGNDIDVDAEAVKDFSSVDVAAAGGLGIGLAGSVGVLQIGGEINSDAKSKGLSNDQGDIVSGASSRSSYSSSTTNSNTNGDSSYTSATIASKRSLVSSETGNLSSEVNCTGNACADNTTSARIEAGTTNAHTQIKAKHAVTVNANESELIYLNASGGAIGAVGVGGWVASAQYQGQVNANVGDYTDVEVGSALSVTAKLGDKLVNNQAKDSSVQAYGVSASVLGGFAGTFALMDVSGGVSALVGNNVSVQRQATLNAGTPDVMLDAERTLNASVTSLGAAASGYGAIGISVANLNSNGDILSGLGTNDTLGTSAVKLGNVTVDAKNSSAWTVSATAGAGAEGLAAVGADATVSDTGNTFSKLGTSTTLNASGALSMVAQDTQALQATSLGVTVGSASISGNANHVDSFRNVGVLAGDNVVISGVNGVTMQASLGTSGVDNIVSSSTAGAGGVLGGAAGSGSYVNVGSQVSSALGNSDDITSTGAVAISATNYTSTSSKSMGVSAGGLGSMGISLNEVDSSVKTFAGFMGTSETIQATSMSVAATNTGHNTLTSVAGAGAIGGAPVGVKSILNDGLSDKRSDTTANIAGNITLTGGDLSVQANDVPVDSNTVQGIAVAGLGGVAGVNVQTFVRRDATATLADATQITANNLTLHSVFGDGSQNTANNDVTSVAGALLLGVQGTDSTIAIDGGSALQIGTNTHITLGGTSANILSEDLTHSRQTVTGVSAGYIAAGGTTGHTDNTGSSTVTFGSGFQIEGNSDTSSTTNLSILASSAKDDRVQVTSGAGGALAVTGAESSLNSHSNTGVALAGTGSGTAGDSNSLKLTGLKNLSIQSLNADQGDTLLDSTNVSVAGGQGGLSQTLINTKSSVMLGDRAYVRMFGDLSLYSSNTSQKFTDGDVENFKAVGVGALNVSVGKSENYLTQQTSTSIGNNSDIFIDGDGYNADGSRMNKALIAAYASSAMKDVAHTSTGGLVAAPVAISDQTSASTTSVSIGNNTDITTWDRDLLVYSKTEDNISSKALVDVYGLASGGASAQALAQQTSSDSVKFGNNTNVQIYGTLDVISGGSSSSLLDQSQHNISSIAMIFNGTAIPISEGKRSNANLNYQSNTLVSG